MSDVDGVHTVSDENKEAWEALLVPYASSHMGPNRAPTIVAPSIPVPPAEETPSIPETPRFDPEQGDPSPKEPAIGVAAKVEARDGVTQTPPILSRLIAINKTLPHFGDVVVVHQPFKKPPSFGSCGVAGAHLGHDNRVAGGVLVVSAVNGALKEVCSTKVRPLGEKAGKAWRLHVHPQDPYRAAYVNRSGEVNGA